ncbi:MAG TPA: hypothetical protein VGQ75_10270 [Thermoanaerobaculia bacterium]|jgi:hypothetical protein|nr:hypothetical protein [Thermoanaerobaculia bacterium]HEV8608844.1 hypothetical protein [Thermoanaerobaculia bacterium]
MARDNVVEMIFRAVNESGSVVNSIVQDQKRIGQAAQQSNQQVKASVAEVNPQFDRLRDQIKGIGTSWAQSGTIGRQSLAALAVSIKQIETAHGGAIQTAQQLEGAERKIYDSAKASLKDAIRYQREFNDEQQKVARATHDWTGLQGSIQGLGGTLGNVAKVAGGVFLAFSEGWRIGKQFDQFLKENSETWRRWNSISTEALRGTNAELVNNLNLTERTRDLLPQIIAGINRRRQGREGGIGAEAGLREMEKVQEDLQRGINDRSREAEELAKKAADATRQWREEVEKLAGIGAAAVREQKILAEAIALIDQQTGKSGAGADYYADRIRKLGEEAERTGGVLDRRLRAALDLLNRPIPQGRTLANLFDIAQPGIPGAFLGDQGREIARQIATEQAARRRMDQETAESLKRAAEEAAQQFTERFEQPMVDIFTDLALNSGRNFGRIAGEMFAESVRDGAEAFVRLLSQGLDQVFGGGRVTQTGTGIFSFGGQEFTGPNAEQEALTAQAQSRARWGQIAGAAIGLGSNIYSAYHTPGRAQPTATSLVLSGAAAGTAALPGWGTLIGAVVGGIAALFQPAVGRDYPYARYGVRGGEPFFDYRTGGGQGRTGEIQNVSTNAARAALAQLRQAYDDAFGDLVRTLLRFPVEVLPAAFATIGDIIPRVGREVGGDMGRAASQTFWRDFQLFFEQGLPRAVSESFRPIFAHAFEAMGFTLNRFNDIWAALGELDPAAARKALDQLVEATVGMRESLEFFSRPFAGAGGMLDWADRENQRSFASQITEQFEEIQRLGDVLGDLPLSEQIRAAAEINRLTTEARESVQDFLREIAQGIADVTASWGASIRDLEIAGIQTPEGAPDYQGQAEYLRNYANQLRQQLASATSPQEAQALGEELRNTIMQIYGLGQQLGPEAGEEFRKWALDALTEGRDLVIEQLRALGQATADALKEQTDRLAANWTEFTGHASDAADNLADAFDRLRKRIDLVKSPPQEGGDSEGGGRRWGPGTPRFQVLPPDEFGTPWITPPGWDEGAPPPPIVPPVTPVYPEPPTGFRPQSENPAAVGKSIGKEITDWLNRSAALFAIGDALKDLGAGVTGGGTFAPLPGGPFGESPAKGRQPYPDDFSHPYYSLYDPTWRERFPQIAEGWDAMRHSTGVAPERPSPIAGGDRISRTIVDAINRASDGDVKGTKILADWLSYIAKVIQAQDKDSGDITIVLPGEALRTLGGTPASRRGKQV